MTLRRSLTVLAVTLVCFTLGPLAAADLTFDRYHKPEEIAAALQDLAKANPAFAKVHLLAKSPGGRDLVLLEIGPETAKTAKTLPAVFVAADMDGTVPLSAEAALWLAQSLCGKADLRADRTWYILACGNPDAASHYFAKPRRLDSRNARPKNDDQDDATDEDGPDDLDGDGLIAQIRVKDPEGTWMAIPGDARLMKKADGTKGEKGVWKLYPEGLDNDRDGQFNEDGPGGISLGTAFPHLYKYHAPDAGPWPGSEPETFALLKFFDLHREIGLMFVLGESSFCLNPPRAGRKGDADFNQIKIPERVAGFLNADPTRTYAMAEIIEMVKPLVPPGMEVTEGLIAGFLELGAAVNPLEDDLKFYKELSEKYKEFLKAAKLDGKRLEAARARDGSPELWSYYHLGVPTFSMDLWTLPESAEESKEKSGITVDALEGMTSEAFVALGDAKVEAFLKEVDAPPHIKAANLIEGVKGGQVTPKQMAGMLRQMPKPKGGEGGDPRQKALLAWSDKELGGKGFVRWTPFKHPTLGDVEIGGAVPFADTTPPAAMLGTVLDGQVPWVLTLTAKLARLRIAKTEVAAKGGGVHELTVWVENTGSLPFPTAMGKRNQQPVPAVVTLKPAGATLLSGKARTPIKELGARKATKLSWLLQASRTEVVSVLLESANAWNDATEVKVGGAK